MKSWQVWIGAGGTMIALLLGTWGLVISGARDYGVRHDRTIGGGAPARLAQRLVPGPDDHRMDRARNVVVDVRPLEFIGPFDTYAVLRGAFEGMRRHRRIAQALVCSLDWDKADASCDRGQDELDEVVEELDVSLCLVAASSTAKSTGLKRCSGVGKGQLVLFLSDEARVVTRERKRACARRACQLRGW